MATINGRTSLSRGYSFWLEVTESIPGDYIDNNYTNVNIKCVLKNGNTRTNSNNWTFEINVDGNNVYRTTGNNLNTTVVGQNQSFTVCETTVRVPHNNDGSKTISVSGYLTKGQGMTSYDPGNCSAEGNVGLTTIPRDANITGFNVGMLDETRISYSISTDVACDAFQYSLNGGAATSCPSSGNIGGLTSGQTYST